MELDAQLFGYCFVAEYLGMCVSQSYISDDYVNVLEEYYVKLHGKTNKEWFSQKNT